MTLYGFKDRSTAENLKQFGEMMNFQRGKNVTRKTGSEVRIAKVDATIAAVANDEWESGTAVIIERKQDGTKVETNYGVMLYNTTGEDLVADQEVTIVRQGEKWITVTGAAAPSGTTSMFISTSSIPANGEGTADTRVYDGTSWTTSNTSSVTVVNPWADAVSTGKLLTAYLHGSGKWIMIQAECEDSV